MLTQLTRFASVMEIELEKAEMDVRASFPTAEKYGVGEGGAAIEDLEYTIDIRSRSPRERIEELVRRSEAACHVASSLRIRARGTLRLTDEEPTG